MTELESKVKSYMYELDYLKISSQDLYMICKNIVNKHDDTATDAQIIEEINTYYNV